MLRVAMRASWCNTDWRETQFTTEIPSELQFDHNSLFLAVWSRSQAARPPNGWLCVHFDLQIHLVVGLSEDFENRCVAGRLSLKIVGGATARFRWAWFSTGLGLGLGFCMPLWAAGSSTIYTAEQQQVLEPSLVLKPARANGRTAFLGGCRSFRTCSCYATCPATDFRPLGE